MRLAAQAKMGYYPTPDRVTRLISGILTRNPRGSVRILDPCAGEGTALKYIGDILQAETYGIELDEDRGTKATEKLYNCLITDYQTTRISNKAFSMLYLNPPYDWAVKDDDSESERYERTFLRNTLKYLMPRGILVYLIPHRRLDKNIAGILAYRFSNIKVLRFPEKEYADFKQLVILGELKTKPEMDYEEAQHLTDVGHGKVIVPYLDNANCNYTVPAASFVKNFIFRAIKINPEELEKELCILKKINQMVQPLSMSEKMKPIMPLRTGHLVQLLACGMMNGIVRDNNGNNPLIIKGITRKEVETNTEYDDGKEKIIETDKIVISVNAMSEFAEIMTIS